MNSLWTIRKLIGWTSEWFAEKQIPSPRLDAEILLSHALGCSRLDLYLTPDKPVDEKERTLFRSYIRRRSNGEPVAYIIERKEFWSRNFFVNRHVLIPRPETEQVIETCLRLMETRQTPVIADMGTGSGCIAVTLALELPEPRIAAVDYSSKAIDVARKNAEVWNVSEKIQFFKGHWFEPLETGLPPGSFDLIVSNPPYIRRSELNDLQVEIRDFEPVAALDGGERGIDHYRILSRSAGKWLTRDGYIVFEIGDDQAEIISGILLEQSFQSIDVLKDLSGRDRVITAQRGVSCRGA